MVLLFGPFSLVLRSLGTVFRSLGTAFRPLLRFPTPLSTPILNPVNRPTHKLSRATNLNPYSGTWLEEQCLVTVFWASFYFASIMQAGARQGFDHAKYGRAKCAMRK